MQGIDENIHQARRLQMLIGNVLPVDLGRARAITEKAAWPWNQSKRLHTPADSSDPLSARLPMQ